MPDPYVVLNVTAEATSNSTITVTWNIDKIHNQLIAKSLTIEYCEMRRDKPEEMDKRCNRCKEKNVTDISSYNVSLTDLRSYTRYGITAQATNIVAKDGTTEVTTPHGNYSNPIYEETHEGGEEFVFLKVCFD